MLLRFVQRVRVLDPSYREAVPWQPRGYSRKRPHVGHAANPQTKRLCSPLLEQVMVEGGGSSLKELLNKNIIIDAKKGKLL